MPYDATPHGAAPGIEIPRIETAAQRILLDAAELIGQRGIAWWGAYADDDQGPVCVLQALSIVVTGDLRATYLAATTAHDLAITALARQIGAGKDAITCIYSWNDGASHAALFRRKPSRRRVMATLKAAAAALGENPKREI